MGLHKWMCWRGPRLGKALSIVVAWSEALESPQHVDVARSQAVESLHVVVLLTSLSNHFLTI